MTGSATDESAEVELEGRPSRLGLGAKITPKSKVAVSTDPVERKLHAKLEGGKKRAAKIQEESNTAEKNEEHSDDEDGDPESRTNAFVKKKAIFVATSLQPKKKHK
ncbi:uncharacterized protein LOC131224730 isoform X2 [Magnolia sinica]|nr:uncharacterized protein LOC131224730 isoform X2 [Magnolia sinica]